MATKTNVRMLVMAMCDHPAVLACGNTVGETACAAGVSVVLPPDTAECAAAPAKLTLTDVNLIHVRAIELVINLKTAKALGLDVPPMLIARAHEVIE
jgi:hypothetical protein